MLLVAINKLLTYNYVDMWPLFLSDLVEFIEIGWCLGTDPVFKCIQQISKVEVKALGKPFQKLNGAISKQLQIPGSSVQRTVPKYKLFPFFKLQSTLSAQVKVEAIYKNQTIYSMCHHVAKLWK